MKISKNLITLIITIALLIAIPLTIYLVRQQQNIKPKAAGDTVTFSLSPLTATKSVNEVFNVDVQVNTNSLNIDGLEMFMNFDASIIEVVGFQKSATFNSEVVKEIGNGTIHYITTDTTQPRKIINGVVTIGTLQLKGKSVGSGQVRFTSARAASNEKLGGYDSVNNGTGTYTFVTSTFSPAPSRGNEVPPVSLILNPSTATKTVNDQFDVTLTLNAGSLNIRGADIAYSINDRLELISFTPSGILPSEIQNNVSASSLRYIAVQTGSTQITGTVNLGSFRLKAKAAGTGTVTLGNTQITAQSIEIAVPTANNVNGSYNIVQATVSPSPVASTCPTNQPLCPRTGTCLDPNVCNPPSISPQASPSQVASIVPSVVPTSSPQGGTKCYKIAEDPATLNAIPDSECIPYSAHPTITNITFADPTPGRKFVYVRYYAIDGRVADANAFIDLIVDPEITGCSIEFKNNLAGFVITGNNFGTVKNKISVGSANPTNFQEWTNTRIIATIPSNQFKDPGLSPVPVKVTRSDGLIASGACSNKANSLLSLGAKLFCPQVAPHVISNADLKIVEATPGGQIVFNKKVTIDEEGVVKEQLPFLKENFGYKLAITIPKGVRQVVEFIAQVGTTNITDFTVHGKRLALGDIAPQGGDGVINSLDKGEMNTEWNLTEEDAGREADLNTDTRVNSVDWACMRYDFGKADEIDPIAGPLKTIKLPSPAPSAIFNNSIDQSI